jgi:hypothetical protein
MYGDYENCDPTAVNELASVLRRQACVTQRVDFCNTADSTTREDHMPRDNHTLGDGDRGGGGTNSQAPASDQANLTPTSSPPFNVQSTSAVTSNMPLSLANSKKMFLELCVNTGELDISLGEIDVSNVTSDGELFRRIYQCYKEIRGHRMRRIFLKPVDVHFIHVSSCGHIIYTLWIRRCLWTAHSRPSRFLYKFTKCHHLEQ